MNAKRGRMIYMGIGQICGWDRTKKMGEENNFSS
jgi:hypothetical protein